MGMDWYKDSAKGETPIRVWIGKGIKIRIRIVGDTDRDTSRDMGRDRESGRDRERIEIGIGIKA